jgi:hypothetical protein
MLWLVKSPPSIKYLVCKFWHKNVESVTKSTKSMVFENL